MQVIIDNLSLSYSKVGTGKSILLLHGWGDSSDTFKSLIVDLSRSYECISLNLPGFGASEIPKSAYDLQKYAETISEFTKKVGCENPAAIIGHSNGGAIALKAVASHLINPEKLILLASSGVRSDKSYQKMALRLGAKIAKVPLSVAPRHTRDNVKRKVYGKLGSDLYVAEHMKETFKNVVSEDILDSIGGVSMPTLLLYGENDDATPVTYGVKIANKIPKSEMVVIKDAGHFLHQSHASEVLSYIKRFLSQ